MFVERLYPELIPYLSTVKSPQAILGSIAKTYFQEKQGIAPGKLVHMALAPCQMKKEEAKRKELWIHENEPNIDAVITTTELAEIFKAWPLDLHSLPKSELDNPLGMSSGAGAIFGTTGGVMEATMRTAYFLLTGKDLENYELQDVRNTGLKHAGTFELAGYKLNICTVNSLAEMKAILDEIKATGKSSYQFIEVMNCPMGCIGGTGQWCTDHDKLMKRREALFSYDKEHRFRASYQNEYVNKIYNDYFGNTDSDLAKKIMHVEYQDRTREPGENFACQLTDNK
jgi:iron only hydrogenase large subunit-like protein